MHKRERVRCLAQGQQAIAEKESAFFFFPLKIFFILMYIWKLLKSTLIGSIITITLYGNGDVFKP